MSWVISVSREAEKQLRRLPGDRREQINRAMDAMSEDPLQGDVVPIQGGKFAGALRRRVGRYRIVFALDMNLRQIHIAAIVPRSEKTYR